MNLGHLCATLLMLSTVACASPTKKQTKTPHPIILNHAVLFTDLPQLIVTSLDDSIEIIGDRVDVESSDTLHDSLLVHYVFPSSTNYRHADYSVYRTVDGVRSKIITANSLVEKSPITIFFGGAMNGESIEKRKLQDAHIWGGLVNYNIELRFVVESFQVVAFPSGRMTRIQVSGHDLSKEQLVMLNSIKPPYPVILDSIIVRCRKGNTLFGPLVFYVK